MQLWNCRYNRSRSCIFNLIDSRIEDAFQEICHGKGIFGLCGYEHADTIPGQEASSICAILELQIQLIEELHLQFNWFKNCGCFSRNLSWEKHLWLAQLWVCRYYSWTGGILNLCNIGIGDTIEHRDASSICAIMGMQISKKFFPVNAKCRWMDISWI